MKHFTHQFPINNTIKRRISSACMLAVILSFGVNFIMINSAVAATESNQQTLNYRSVLVSQNQSDRTTNT
ncbi:MAG: hypothetical protein WBV73_07005, partial [Phormidium sp.]